jgi:putative two-component system response regulator
MNAKVTIIDDDPLNVRILKRQLEKLGFTHLQGISESLDAISGMEEFRPDVVLMDVMMPGLSGPELLQIMRQHNTLRNTPVITLTASRDRETRLQVLQLGVSDFLSKPVDEAELITRLNNVIEAKRYRDELSQSAQRLEVAVQRRTSELEASRRDVVMCLARAAEHRDDNTGQHVVRVGKYSAALAREMGYSTNYVEMIELAAQLHDVGKIGIPDAILHKPGKLTDEEMDHMRRHAMFGWNIIAPLNELKSTSDEDGVECLSPMLVMAAKIASSHHERWDGQGYPHGISGDKIPLEARITAVADVFDALSTPRSYKAAFPLEKCFAIIESDQNKHFDPQVVAACMSIKDIFAEIHHQSMAEETQTV